MSICYPESLDLARLKTPLTLLPRLSEQLGVDIYCKRDDLIGSGLSGNKVRKLEFLLYEALEGGFGGVITCGGAQSNHVRATAISAARLGLSCQALLRVADPANPPPLDGNALLAKLAGAQLHYISADDYARRDELLAEYGQRAERETGARFYLVPEGGSNALGAYGYVKCVEEIAAQLTTESATIVYAVGSGGTGAGLIAGCRLLNLPYRVIGVSVCDPKPVFQQRIAGILQDMSTRFGVDVATDAEGIEIWDDYVGRGYALSRRAELETIGRLACLEGLLLDPVYSGKAMHGLLAELTGGRRLPQPIVFLHTGGVFGLFAKRQELGALLD